jgi:hypothetical protein
MGASVGLRSEAGSVFTVAIQGGTFTDLFGRKVDRLQLQRDRQNRNLRPALPEW